MCHSYCITDNFPDSVCDKRDYAIEYNGNKYSKFFYYPNPIEHFKIIKTETAKNSFDDLVITKKDYGYCKDQIKRNAQFDWSKIEIDRQWKVHSCFESCKPDVSKLDAAALATYKKAFKIDNRPVCEETNTKGGKLDVNKNNGIICLDPFENVDNCEIYQPVTQICYDDD